MKEVLGRKYWWSLKSYQFNLVFTFFTLLAYNSIFFKRFYAVTPTFTFAFFWTVCVVILLNMCCTILLFKYTSKFWVIALCFINTIIFYFMSVYHIEIDKIMLLNALETDANEAGELFSMTILWYLLFLFVIPTVLVTKTRIVYASLGKEILRRFLTLLVSFLIVAGLVFGGYKNTAQFMRNNRPLRYLLVPVNYIGAIISVVKILKKASHTEVVKIGNDAVLESYWKDKNKKNLLVFVVGETARAANFSLNGYGRKTDEPLFKYQEELLNFRQAISCGTSTAVSLPCMFSKFERRHFNAGESDYTENVLDVAQKAGYKILWRENNSGCKGVCKRVETEKPCATGACFDEVLAKGLSEKIKSYDENMLVVLHQMGSHGPTYYLRYPKKDEKFKPICDTERLDKCSQEEIVNVYDNTIYYTAKNLSEIIDEIKPLSDKYNVVLMYASDHGESLGENNIYLHAAPYMIAPDEQTHIPMMVWFDEATAKNLGINRKCMQAKTGTEVSHDNLFHSILGILGVKTQEYNPELDIWKTCRS